MAEWLDIYDDTGNRVGRATRRECHGNPALLHHTAHVVVIDRACDRILLQKRSAVKEIQPGKWDTAVGGHLDSGEDYETAARREMREELGIVTDAPLEHIFDDRIRNEIESEDVRVFRIFHDGPFDFSRDEIDEVRFFAAEELLLPENIAEFTPNLVSELNTLRERGIFPTSAK